MPIFKAINKCDQSQIFDFNISEDKVFSIIDGDGKSQIKDRYDYYIIEMVEKTISKDN